MLVVSDARGGQPADLLVEVYVAGHCVTCETAIALSLEMRARYPTVGVRLVDLDREPARRPPTVVAVPTFIVAGRVVFLGNPAPQELFDCIAAFLNGG